MGLIDAVHAAEIFHFHHSNVRDIVRRGLLATEKSGKKLLFSEEAVKNLKAGIDLRRKLDEAVKEIFVLSREGAHLNFLAKSYNVGQIELENALRWYEVERKPNLNGSGNNPDALLTGEVAARLKIIAKNPIYSLIDEEKLIIYIGYQHIFVSLQSLISYLGNRNKHPLYTSREAVQLLSNGHNGLPTNGVRVADIDTAALRYGFGMKIQDKLMSEYRFTRDEVYKLRKRM